METTVQHNTAGVPAAAEHTKISIELLTKIAAKRQVALDKKTFREWENSNVKSNENKNNLTNKDDSGQTGAALPVGMAVHAALGRNFMKSFRQKSTTIEKKKHT